MPNQAIKQTQDGCQTTTARRGTYQIGIQSVHIEN